MKKLVGTTLALAMAFIASIPGIAAARITANRNQTVLRFVAVCGVIVALMSLLPGVASARWTANHSQTLLRA
jgi:TctA family transporter